MRGPRFGDPFLHGPINRGCIGDIGLKRKGAPETGDLPHLGKPFIRPALVDVEHRDPRAGTEEGSDRRSSPSRRCHIEGGAVDEHHVLDRDRIQQRLHHETSVLGVAKNSRETLGRLV